MQTSPQARNYQECVALCRESDPGCVAVSVSSKEVTFQLRREVHEEGSGQREQPAHGTEAEGQGVMKVGAGDRPCSTSWAG